MGKIKKLKFLKCVCVGHKNFMEDFRIENLENDDRDYVIS